MKDERIKDFRVIANLAIADALNSIDVAILSVQNIKLHAPDEFFDEDLAYILPDLHDAKDLIKGIIDYIKPEV